VGGRVDSWVVGWQLTGMLVGWIAGWVAYWLAGWGGGGDLAVQGVQVALRLPQLFEVVARRQM
jgi:hypothetical protein